MVVSCNVCWVGMGGFIVGEGGWFVLCCRVRCGVGKREHVVMKLVWGVVIVVMPVCWLGGALLVNGLGRFGCLISGVGFGGRVCCAGVISGGDGVGVVRGLWVLGIVGGCGLVGSVCWLI